MIIIVTIIIITIMKTAIQNDRFNLLFSWNASIYVFDKTLIN